MKNTNKLNKPKPKFLMNINRLPLVDNTTTNLETPMQKHREDDFSEVLDGKLYLTGTAVTEESHKSKFTHQLNVTKDNKLKVDGKEYLQIPISDDVDTKIAQYLPEVFSFIRKAIKKEGSVVVNCHKGKSRSATLLLAFIMTNANLFPGVNRKENENIASYDDALDYLRNKRDIIEPNFGFCGFLSAYSEILRLFNDNKEEINKYLKKTKKTCIF